jgi:probable rRNA maturation factor
LFWSHLGTAQQGGEEAAERDLVILQKKVAGLSESALNRFVLRARRAAGLRGRVNVLVAGSAAVRSLNRQFRGKNKATDVLSFPFTSLADGPRNKLGLAGEIAISADIAAQNAVRLGHSPAQEIRILTLHGILHLAGMDHERDNGEMARKEATFRRMLKLPAALIERTESAKPRRRISPTKAARRTA